MTDDAVQCGHCLWAPVWSRLPLNRSKTWSVPLAATTSWLLPVLVLMVHAQEVIQEETNQRLKIHMAHIRPDVSPGMDGLLKDTPQSQLFTVFGQPDVEVIKAKKGEDGELQVELKGVDIYSPTHR